MERTTTDEILRKYGAEIERKIGVQREAGDTSSDFLAFKKDALPETSRYEKFCKSIGSIFRLRLSKKDSERLQKSIDIAHLEITPSQAASLAFISLFILFFSGVLISASIYMISNNFPFLLLILTFVFSLFLFFYLSEFPTRLAQRWRLRASSQMVDCILYIVVYMKHTSNLEMAVRFASEHLRQPLSLDLKKVFWDVEVGKFSNVKESLDAYLETWREYSIEFIEAFHLIESSLYEPSDSRRVQTLEKALEVILDGVYEKMLKYSREIRSPLTNLYMLGIVLPTLTLALLPLASTLLQGAITWYMVFVLFNLIIPFFVFYLTSEIMMKRPGGHGESEVLEMNPLYPQYKSNAPFFIAFFLCLPLILIGLIPLLAQTELAGMLGMQNDYSLESLGLGFMGQGRVFDFKATDTGMAGPFGIIALLLSLFIPLGIALFFSIAYEMKTKEMIKEREKSKQLEKEFASSLFQLGNRLGDGIPAEIAFARIAESTKGQATENFFRLVNTNVQQLGMSVEQAIFNQKRGAIIFYPSALISTSMKILVESAKKGLDVAARSLMSISEYVKNIDKISERLRDLLAEVVSDMKSNMTFLAPLLAGIVIGLAGMITSIINTLTELMAGISTEAISAESGTIGNMLKIFDITTMIPPYFLQIAVGIYIVQIIFILTDTLVLVDAGDDRLKKIYDLSRNLKRGILLYFVVAFITILALSVLAKIALGGIAPGG